MVSRSWIVTGIAGFLGCSNPALRPEQAVADTLRVETSGTTAADSASEGSQPTVLFRCEAGRVGAYIVPGSLDTLPWEDQLVPIALDSAPEC
jgi:hypothetical protein